MNNNLNKPKTLAKDVYAQIIADAQIAASLINGNAGAGFCAFNEYVS